MFTQLLNNLGFGVQQTNSTSSSEEAESKADTQDESVFSEVCDDNELQSGNDCGDFGYTDDEVEEALQTITKTVTDTVTDTTIFDKFINSVTTKASDVVNEYLINRTRDGEISETKQGNTGDCWLLSGVNALSYTEAGREIIENALEYNEEEGYTTVHLATGDIVITDEELIKGVASFKYSSGDSDMVLVELAIEKTMDMIASGELNIDLPYFMEDESQISEETSDGDLSIEGGNALQLFYFLTGQVGERTDDTEEIENKLDEFAQNAGVDMAMTASINGTEDCIVEDAEGNKIRIYDHHAYAVQSVDDDYVYLTNPWNSDKVICLDRETFLETFGHVYTINLSDSPAYES